MFYQRNQKNIKNEHTSFKESNEKTKDGISYFSICCQKGRVILSKLKETPKELEKLLENPHFRENIKVYNFLLAFTSTGAKVDNSVMIGPGPYSYRIHGKNHHKIGALLPEEGEPAKFAQLYIYDTSNEVQNRINTMVRKQEEDKLEEKIVEDLIKMLDENNFLAKEFRKARDRYESGEIEKFTIRLIGQTHLGRQYDLPTTDETAGLFVGDMESTTIARDVIVQYRSKELQRISTLHQHYMAFQYPLLFPYGESGFNLQIPYRKDHSKEIKRKNVTIQEFYAYQLQTRLSEGKTLIKGGRLLHQFIVDAYTAIEEDRLRFNRDNPQQLRVDLYTNVCDAIRKGDTDSKALGRRIILLAAFTGGPRYMLENYHDAMALCKTFGNPHLFITITANPNWPEIKEHLLTYGKHLGNDMPDIATRVFKLKLDELISYLKERIFSSPVKAGKQSFNVTIYSCPSNFYITPYAVVYTIKFQKRGLPHAHIQLWQENTPQNPSPKVVDAIISEEIPDKDKDPERYELVRKHMMHGPCGVLRPQCPCMANEICTKKYLRAYAESTSCDKNGYIIYKRQEDEKACVMKRDIKLDNRHVIPHNMSLLKKYKTHINVEWCSTSKAIKYIFKYITKGVDRATYVFEKKVDSNGREYDGASHKIESDEIKEYQECRFLSACEAAWRIFAFDIHHQKPSVVKLPIHLECHQNVVYHENQAP